MGSSKKGVKRWLLDTKNEVWLSLIATVVVALIFWLCRQIPISDTKTSLDWTLMIFVEIVILVLSFFAIRSGIRWLVYESVYNDFFVPKESNFKLIAEGKGGEIFEEKIQLLRKIPSVEQIIAQFISEKLKNDFVELRFKTTTVAYSDFAKELLDKADEVLLANAFNPYKWLKALFTGADFEDVKHHLSTKKKFGLWIESERKRYTPAYIKQLIKIDEKNRKRLIILNNFENLFLYETYYLYFKDLNESTPNDTRFTTYDSLKNHHAINIDVKRYDYVMFNDKIALEWNFGGSGNLQLIADSSNPIVQALKTIKSRWLNSGNDGFESIEEIENKINRSKRKYFKEIMDENPDVHSYCYHAYGADCWEKINKDTHEYYLGSNEFNFLTEIFLPRLSATVLGGDNAGHCNVLHIGVGSGMEINSIITNVHRFKKINKYAIVDISQGNIEKALERIAFDRIEHRMEPKIEILFGDPVNVTNADLGALKFNRYSSMNTGDNEFLSGRQLLADNCPLIIVLVANGYLFSQKSLLERLTFFMRHGDYLLVTTEVNNSCGNNDSDEFKEITKSYKAESVLKLFNISLNPLNIDVFENTRIFAGDYFHFRFQELNSMTNHAEYEKDIYEGYFNLVKWRENNGIFNLNDFDGIENMNSVLEFLNTRSELKIFQSYKPSGKKSIESYIRKFEDLEILDIILNIEGTNSPNDNIFGPSNDYNQVGFVIKKE